jgi:hypothetical protein
MKKKLKLFVYFLIVLFIIAVIFIGNSYIQDNNYLYYATGLDEKAFLNSTWLMSPKEIERANNTFLSKSDMLDFFLPDVTDITRFTTRIQDDVYLWGHRAKVEYMFFDDMLYKYYIPLTVYTYSKETLHEEILKTLRRRFGKEKEVERKTKNMNYKCSWEADNQIITYYMGKYKKKNSYFVNINAEYRPFYKQIKEIAKKDKTNYF